MRDITDLLGEPKDDLTFGEDDDAVNENGTTDEEVLCLPSDFTSAERQEYNLETHANYELLYRQGYAYDLLWQVREAVQNRAATLQEKRTHARGQKDNAAANSSIQDQDRFTATLVDQYNANYERILKLRPDTYKPSEDHTGGARLRRINPKTDLKVVNVTAIRTAGDSKVTGSWIWSVTDPTSTEDAGDTATSDSKCVRNIYRGRWADHIHRRLRTLHTCYLLETQNR